jgi:hypothetical protein
LRFRFGAHRNIPAGADEKSALRCRCCFLRRFMKKKNPLSGPTRRVRLFQFLGWQAFGGALRRAKV